MYFLPSTELGIIKNKTGYEAKDHESKYSKVSYFEVIAPLKWSGLSEVVPELIPIGSLTWCYGWSRTDESVLLEDNRYGINFHPDCLRFIKHEFYGGQEIQSNSKNADKEYRFKTKSEFIDIGKWNSMTDNNGYPLNWDSKLRMNHYIGKALNKYQQELVKKMLENGNDQVFFDGYSFYGWDFMELKPGDIYPSIEMLGIQEVPGIVKEGINSPQTVQKVDWSEKHKIPPLSSTIEQQAPIIYENKKKELNNDIVVELTINITI